MKAVILAAGLSTRLYPLTKECPKPMLNVNGKPMMEHVVRYLVANGFDDIIITLHYKPNVIRNYFGNGCGHNAKIEYVYEESLLGTAGSIKNIENKLSSDFLVCSGSYLPIHLDIGDVKREHCSSKRVGTVVVATSVAKEYLKNYGQAILDHNKCIIRFEEKPKKNFSNYVHTTYQMYSPDVMKYIKRNCFQSLPDDIIPTIVKEKGMFAYIYEGKLLGISTPEAYIETDKFISDIHLIGGVTKNDN